MRRSRSAWLMYLVILVMTLAPVQRGSGAPPPSRQLTFEDRRTGHTLTVETDSASPEAGRFSVSVPGRGTFIGVERASLRSNRGAGATVVILDYDGDVDLISSQGGTREPSRFKGLVDVDHHTAEATLWFGISHGSPQSDEPPTVEQFHIVATTPSPAGLREAADSFASAMLASDWSAVYDIASADLRGTAGQQDFVASARAEMPDRVLRLDVGEIEDPSTHPLGFVFAVVQMDALHEGAGGGRAVAYDAYFVLEGPDWKLWFTVER